MRHKYDLSFKYRDPWEWLKRLLSDPTLRDHLVYFSCRKFYCWGDGTRVQLRDEPCTGRRWYSFDVCSRSCPLFRRSLITIQTELPAGGKYPHVYLPTHLWIDEGLVTKHILKQPMLLRFLGLPSSIFNGSGDGGSLLLGLMPQVCISPVVRLTRLISS